MQLNGCVNSMNIITANTKIDINKDFKIEAGPGAGKTQFLVKHIKNVLQASKILGSSRKIACITYTNTAVNTILKRLGSGVSNKVEVSTIHSFLYRNVVKPYCSFLPAEYNVCIGKIKGHEDPFVNYSYTKDWLNNSPLIGLQNPNSKKQLRDLPNLNKALRNWLLTMKCNLDNNKISFVCDNKKANAYDKRTQKTIGIKHINLNILQQELLEYKKLYWEKGKIDHEDVLFFSYTLIKNYPFILTVLCAKFPYFFIDEFQDTNPIQSFLIDEIRKGESTVGIIGDKAQSIYSFQGAIVSLFTKFKVDSSNSHTILENHRSSNQITTFLNTIRKDITQKPCRNMNDLDVTLLIGSRKKTYDKAENLCNNETITSLARDNITSNVMKNKIEGSKFDRKLIENLENTDSNKIRKNYIISFIKAIELARNTNFKEALKKIDWLFKDEDNPKKQALTSLSIMLKLYSQYKEDSLLNFYSILCDNLKIQLSRLNCGSIKKFEA